MPPPNEVLSGVSECETAAWIMHFSYTLSREYRVLRNRYSWLLFTSENRFYVNLRLQEQSANMTPQYTTFASRHRSTVVGDVTRLSQKRPPLVTMAKSAIDFVFSIIVCSRQSSVQDNFLVTREARHFITCEHYRQIASLVFQKLQFNVTRALFVISTLSSTNVLLYWSSTCADWQC